MILLVDKRLAWVRASPSTFVVLHYACELAVKRDRDAEAVTGRRM